MHFTHTTFIASLLVATGLASPTMGPRTCSFAGSTQFSLSAKASSGEMSPLHYVKVRGDGGFKDQAILTTKDIGSGLNEFTLEDGFLWNPKFQEYGGSWYAGIYKKNTTLDFEPVAPTSGPAPGIAMLGLQNLDGNDCLVTANNNTMGFQLCNGEEPSEIWWESTLDSCEPVQLVASRVD